MDDYFYRVFMDSMDSLNAEQAQAIANRLSDMGYVSNRMNPLNAAGQPVPPAPLIPPPVGPIGLPSPIRQALAFKEGDRVRLVNNISPRYLVGSTGTVTKVNGSTISGRTKIRVQVRLDIKSGRFSNAYPIGVPVGCLELITP